MDPLPFLLQPPVFYPIIPYACTIFGGLRPGRMILIQGSAGISATRFQIDFQCGCSTRPRSDIAFHFNPRFSSSDAHVICNTLRKDHWLDELKFSGAPLKKGETFVLLFLFLPDKVKVSIGGHHFLDFTYRLPLKDVDAVGLYGDVTIKELSFLSSNPLKSGSADLQKTPLSKTFPMGLSECQVIAVRGLVTANPDELTLQLKSSDSIPFKLTANFQDQTLSYNSFISQSWGQPQNVQTPFFLFYPERFFEILLLPEAGLFKLAINGTPVNDYRPLVFDLKSIEELQITGSAGLFVVQC
ncbi:galectin-12 isoform X2 [Lithobates pipiens]